NDDAYAAAVHLVDLTLHGLVEEPHQSAHLGARPGPVLSRERVDRQHVHAQLLAAFERPLDRAHAGPVAEAGRAPAAARPAAVAVHDDSDVPGNRRVQAGKAYAGGSGARAWTSMTSV